MQLHHWWCFSSHRGKPKTSFYIWKYFFFLLFLKVSQIDGCSSLSCTCAMLLWEWPPVFSLSVCWSLCQTSLIPQMLIAGALRGDTPPLFTQHVQTEASTPAWSACLCLSAHQIQPAATVVDVLPQQQNSVCTPLAVLDLNSKLITNMRNETINSQRMKIKLWTRIKSSRIKDLNLKIIQPLIINKSPSSYNGNP